MKWTNGKKYQLVISAVSVDYDDDRAGASKTTFVGMYNSKKEIVDEVNTLMEEYTHEVIEDFVDLEEYDDPDEYEEEAQVYKDNIKDNTEYPSTDFEENTNDFELVGSIGYTSDSWEETIQYLVLTIEEDCR